MSTLSDSSKVLTDAERSALRATPVPLPELERVTRRCVLPSEHQSVAGADRAEYLLRLAEDVIRATATTISRFESDMEVVRSVPARDLFAFIRDLRNSLELYWDSKHRYIDTIPRHEHVGLEDLERPDGTTSLRTGWVGNNDSMDAKGV